MKSRSQKQEGQWADLVNGRRTIGSGNLWFQKGDVDHPNWKFELKTTKNKYYSLHLKDLKFCLSSAYAAHKKPAFVIQFDNNNNYDNIVIMPSSDYEGDIDIDSLPVLELKKKQLRIKQDQVMGKVSILMVDRRKYLIFPEDIFIENILNS